MTLLPQLPFALPEGAILRSAVAVVVGAVTLIVLEAIRSVVTTRLARLAEHTKTGVDDLLIAVLQQTKHWFMVLLAVAAGASVLILPGPVQIGLRVTLVIGAALQVGLWLSRLFEGLLNITIGHHAGQSGAGKTTLVVLRFLCQMVLWSALMLLALANLGVDVTALVAGLGIGGIAVALAVQNVLGDLFASLAIVLDRPFEVGDFVIVDDFMGTVQRVGMKTTRIQSLSGEQLIFSNANLLNSRIRNYQRMRERRVQFNFGVSYLTKPEQVRRIPDMIREAIQRESPIRFDRAHLKEFGASALVFEAVYYVLDADHNRYMDIQQRINLALLEGFSSEGIDFAFPAPPIALVGAAAAT